MIGIFDSGVGGLTVVKEFKKYFPQLPFIYLGDNARTPYGSRGVEVIRNYAHEDAEFLIKRGVKIIIIACNTASAQAGDFLKEQYPEIKIFEVIKPAAAAAAAASRGRIGVIGTRGTVQSGAYEREIKKINPELMIFSQACPLLVPLIEQDWAKRPETKTITRKYLSPLKLNNIDTLILGCTHYPLIRRVVQEKIGRRIKLIDPAEEVIKELVKYLTAQNQDFIAELANGETRYFTTDLGSNFKDIARKWLKESIKINSAM